MVDDEASSTSTRVAAKAPTDTLSGTNKNCPRAVMVVPPDDELLGSIILKQLADRQLHAGAGVVHYLVSHMERSADSARRVVAALDRRGLAERREIDRRLAADVLAELSSPVHAPGPEGEGT